jgi:hypothetical protein
MRASRCFLVVALACLANSCLSNICLSTLASAQQPDQVVAGRVLGPQWKQLSRRAGMIFAGTVLTAAPPTAMRRSETTEASDRVSPGPPPAIQLSFRVDEAIAGVEPGQILTIHEWAGAWSRQRPMHKGQHILIFLYKPSRLGFTSPVGGSQGQVALDQTGKTLAEPGRKPAAPAASRNTSSALSHVSVGSGSVSVVQLERAIRSAREE